MLLKITLEFLNPDIIDSNTAGEIQLIIDETATGKITKGTFHVGDRIEKYLSVRQMEIFDMRMEGSKRV